MDYLEMKLRNRLVTDPAKMTPDAEAQLFYDSFAGWGERRIWLRQKLAFWRNVFKALPPAVRDTTFRKVTE